MTESTKDYVHLNIVYMVVLINFIGGIFVGVGIMGLGI